MFPAIPLMMTMYSNDHDNEHDDADSGKDGYDEDGDNDGQKKSLQWTEILHWSSIPEFGMSSFLACGR